MTAVLILALVFQLAGSAIVVWEVWQGHRRWAEKFAPKSITGTLAIQGEPFRVRFTGLAGRPQGLTLEERVTALEASQDQAAMNLIDAVNRLEDQVIPGVASEAARDVENRLEPVIRDALAYLAGLGKRSKWMPWWLGPSLLLLGTLLGGGAAVVDVLGT